MHAQQKVRSVKRGVIGTMIAVVALMAEVGFAQSPEVDVANEPIPVLIVMRGEAAVVHAMRLQGVSVLVGARRRVGSRRAVRVAVGGRRRDEAHEHRQSMLIPPSSCT